MSRRLFFALWPDRETRDCLVETVRPLREGIEGRMIPDENLHVTLNFLGRVGDDRMDDVCSAAANVRGRSFTLVLDHLGYWPQPKVAWLGTGKTPPELVSLVADLNTELGSVGFDFPGRPFRPHLTIARGAESCDNTGNIDPVHWQVRRFVLIESITSPQGSSYEVLDEWRLGETVETEA